MAYLSVLHRMCCNDTTVWSILPMWCCILRCERAASSMSAHCCWCSLCFFLSMILTLSNHLSRVSFLILSSSQARLNQGSRFTSSWFNRVVSSRCITVPCNKVLRDLIFTAHSQKVPDCFVPRTLWWISCFQLFSSHLLWNSFMKLSKESTLKPSCPIQYQSANNGSCKLPAMRAT